jgi:hypothetical protein
VPELPDDDGVAISYKLLARGTPIHSADGERLGTVDRVLDNAREQIFDGIVMRTESGEHFVDAPEVARIAERRVTLTITAAEVAELPEQPGLRGTLERSARRTGVRWRRRLGR